MASPLVAVKPVKPMVKCGHKGLSTCIPGSHGGSTLVTGYLLGLGLGLLVEPGVEIGEKCTFSGQTGLGWAKPNWAPGGGGNEDSRNSSSKTTSHVG